MTDDKARNIIENFIKSLIPEQVVIAKVSKINKDKALINAKLIDDEGIELFDVRLTATSENKNECVVLFPKNGSYVLISLIKNNSQNNYVSLFTEIDEIQLRGDQYGGLTQHDNLVTQLNMTKALVDAIKNVMLTWVPVANDGGAALKALATSTLASLNTGNYSNLSNEKIKHG